MKTYDIIKQLRSYCISKGITFIPALTEDYINAIADTTYYNYNQLILVAMLNRRVTRQGVNVVGVQFNGVIGLGRKRDQVITEVENEDDIITNTESSLDETFEQKYDRRLSDLTFALQDFISDFGCSEELDVLNENQRMEINQLDLNADFVFCDITLAK